MKKLAPLMIIGAGCLWGCMGILVRGMNAIDLDTMEIVVVRCLVTFACMAVGFFVSSSDPSLHSSVHRDGAFGGAVQRTDEQKKTGGSGSYICRLCLRDRRRRSDSTDNRWCSDRTWRRARICTLQHLRTICN